MTEYWNTFSGNAKFSLIAFMSSLALGLISMGALGGLIYYPVSFLFKKYGSINSWHGDEVWPTLIWAGMLWAFGFLIAGYLFSVLKKTIDSKLILYLNYTIVLWLWAAIVWYFLLSQNKFQTS